MNSTNVIRILKSLDFMMSLHGSRQLHWFHLNEVQ